MKPLLYGARNGEVIIETLASPSGDYELVVDRHNTNTLLDVTLNALKQEGDAAKLDAAAMSCIAFLGRARFG